jgi:ferrochelatase
MNKRHAVLLINLGSPRSTSVPDVRRYLREFLMDKYVIDLPWLFRALLVHGVILMTRPAKTAEAYKKIWTKMGSPLINTSKAQHSLLQSCVDFPVALAMRYGAPSIEKTVESLVDQYPLLKSIHVIPLYPHYAMASTKTVEVLTKKMIKRAKHTIKVSFQSPFYDDTTYLDAVASIMKPEMGKSDHLIFSYHGIPIRHLRKTDPTGRHCVSNNCCKHPSKAWETCYKYQTIVTTRKLAALLQLSEGDYTISYQSRLGNDPWILPNTETVVRDLADRGVKRLGIVCPSFVTDCLETLEEVDMGLRELFLENGGESFNYIPCLNTSDKWIQTLRSWVENHTVV